MLMFVLNGSSILLFSHQKSSTHFVKQSAFFETSSCSAFKVSILLANFGLVFGLNDNYDYNTVPVQSLFHVFFVISA